MHALVHAADVQDRDGGVVVMATLFGLYPFLLKLYADGGYQGPQFQEGLRRVCRRVRVEIVKRSDQAKGFAVLPKRWIVLPCTILPGSASSGRPWSLASI
jgi:transposase